jgi:hypothetical protein
MEIDTVKVGECGRRGNWPDVDEKSQGPPDGDRHGK